VSRKGEGILSCLFAAASGALLAFSGSNALAFGDEGHEIIAVIAYGRLTPAARKQVDALLAADKKDKSTAPDFVSRATWADKYRDSDRNSTKIRYNATEHWHFVDIELDNADLDAGCNQHPPLPSGTAASAGPADDCVVDKIEQFTAELRNASTAKAEKILALKFVLHFVGDVHQPLHAADHQDRGGNLVSVLFGNPAKTGNLHAYWDTELVRRLGSDPKTVAGSLNKKITKAQASDWSMTGPRDWVLESFGKAKGVAYNFSGEAIVDDHGTSVPRLDAVYDARALPVMREQLSKAGVRLAAVLNDSLK